VEERAWAEPEDPNPDGERKACEGRTGGDRWMLASGSSLRVPSARANWSSAGEVISGAAQGSPRTDKFVALGPGTPAFSCHSTLSSSSTPPTQFPTTCRVRITPPPGEDMETAPTPRAERMREERVLASANVLFPGGGVVEVEDRLVGALERPWCNERWGDF